MRKKLGENMKYHYYEVIEKLKKRGSSPGLETVRGLLDVLGHPEERLRIVHIAGTNGKGSVFAFLASMLKEGGYRVGRYISPTLYSYRERFQINGEYISREDYVSAVVGQLELLPPETVIERITGDADRSQLLAPLWSADKKKVLNAISKL